MEDGDAQGELGRPDPFQRSLRHAGGRAPKAAAILKKRTLTNLYNERPAWLANAHRELDEAVAAAYGWPADLGDEEILKRLFDLNQERASKQPASGKRKSVEAEA